MSKKLLNKLLSAILVLAICSATVFGCMMNVSASDFDGTYTISVGDEKNAVPFASTAVTAQVKFDLPAGFAGGKFTIVSNSSYTVGDEVKAVAGTLKDGGSFDADVIEVYAEDGTAGKEVTFFIDNGATYYTSITLELAINMVNPAYVNCGGSNVYPISVDVDGADFSVAYDVDVTFTASAESDSKFHAHYASYSLNNVDENKDGKHTVTIATCPHCPSANSANEHPQVIPDYTEFDGAGKLYAYPVGWMGISGLTVNYNDNGTLDVNVHAYAQYHSDKVFLIVTDTNGNELMRTEKVENGSSHLANNGFPAGEKCFTLSNFSARNIHTPLLITMIAVYDESGTMAVHNSRTVSFSLASYAEKVVDEEAFWPYDATLEEIEADKDVAAALYYYGASIDESVFEKPEAGTGSNSGSEEDNSIEYIKPNVDTWDGTKSEPTETDDEGNIIIRTAEQMAWVSLQGGDATQNKNYKVADNTVFNMNGMEGINVNSTLAQVKAATATGTYWRLDADGSSPAFQGNFDGNGLIVYNIYTGTGRSHCGLFPATHSAAQGSITIENVSVVASHIGAYHGAGAIVGIANTSNTSTKMYFENCAVKNCFIYDNDDANPAVKKIGGLIAGEIVHNATTINNCLALNNQVDSQGIQGGFFGNSSNYAGQSTVSNSIIIGSNKEPVSIGTALATKVATTTYTNVYDSESAQKGLDAVSGMGLNSSVWLANTSYPELSLFHNMVEQYVDESTHRMVCNIEIDGVKCKLTGATVAHKLVEDQAGENMVCACGYSEKIISKIDYIDANYDEWDGTKVQPTATDDAGNIIINTAEELAWIALQGGDATQNKNYKVADNTVFNMNGMEGINVNSTLAQVKAATATGTYWRLDGDGSSPAFQGNFDGNGLIVYNIYTGTGRSHCGLFPATHSAAQGSITIENVSVVASHIGGYHGAGAIVGIANTSSTSTKMYFENCAVKNCFIYDNDDANPATKKIGGLIAGEIVHNAATINNCLALNNEIDSQGIKGGFFGNSSDYAGQSTVSNSIIIGSNKEPVSIGTALATKVATTTYTNVHTADVDAATLGSDWFDTESYPELSIFHKMATKYVNEETHKSICTIVINGENCDVCGVAEEHKMVENAEGTANECECGYAVEIEQVVEPIDYINANYDEWDGTKVQPTATDDAGNIIINTAEELAWVAIGSTVDATKNKNYKVAPNSIFNMNGKSGITLNSTVAEVEAAALTNVGAWKSDNNKGDFAGNFDGNGVTVYNLYSKGGGYGGLFPSISTDNTACSVTIKNIALKASYLSGYHYSGGIVALAFCTTTSQYLNIENCKVESCHISDDSNTNSACSRTAGGLLGNGGNNTLAVSDCISLNNNIVATEIYGGLVGNTGAYSAGAAISNSIAVGTTPIPVDALDGGQSIGKISTNGIYTNVYTDQPSDKSGVTTGTATAAQLGDAWFDTESYPELSIFHKFAFADNGDGTHTPMCSLKINGTPCGVCKAAEAHTLTEDQAGENMVCVCGYSEKIISKIDYIDANYDEWDGTKVQPTATDDAGNIIINTAEELAWIALGCTPATTTGKTYKVAANSVFNLMGMDGITLNSTATDVQAATKTYQKRWIQDADSNTTHAFQGNFDGNGLIVYNLSAGAGGGQGYSGLFPVVKQAANGDGVTIKNVKVMASYFVGYHAVGAIVGLINAPGTSCTGTFENLVVQNCVLTDNNNSNGACQRTVGNLIGNVGHTKYTLNNCAAINNTLSAVNIVGGFVANTSAFAGQCSINNSIIIGSTQIPEEILTSDSHALNTPATNATLTNVHTADVAAATLGSAWFDTESYPELSIFHKMATKYVNEETHKSICTIVINGENCDVCGLTSAHEMSDNAEGTLSECECGYSYEIKGIHAMGLPESIVARITANETFKENFATDSKFKAAYSEDVNPTSSANDCYMYGTSLNLKTNPHIAFTFAFVGDYKTNKADLTATFTVGGEQIASVSGADMINNAGAGRYHLYRFKALPVTKLCETVAIKVTYGGQTIDMGTYSAAGYAITALNLGADYRDHASAAMSLVYYSEMLQARYGA